MLQQLGSLAEIAAKSGTREACSSNLPLDMGDPQSAWFVEEGAVDLFLVERRDGADLAPPQYMMRAEAGHFLPGVAPQGGDAMLGLIGKGLPDTALRRLPVAALAEVRSGELAEHVNAWLVGVSDMLARDVVRRPRPDVIVTSGQTLPSAGGTVAARRGVVWLSGLPLGAGLYLGLADPVESLSDGGAATGTVPLTPAAWLDLTGEARLAAQSTETLAQEGLLLPALANFHAMAFSLERLNRNLAIADQANIERERASDRRSDEERARRRLFNLYDLPEEEDAAADGAALVEALRVIGDYEGIDFKWPERLDASDVPSALGGILDLSGVRCRQVRLDREARWWIGDSGALLGFQGENDQPVALLPGVFGRYHEVAPARRRRIRITAKLAESFREDAWLFYQPLPPGVVGPRDLMRLVRKNLATDLLRFGAAGFLSGLVMLLPAVVVGFLVNEVVPAGEAGLLYSATAALAVVAGVGALLHIFQGMALMRLEGHAASRIEAAFWDRLLRLPLNILRRYPAGNLAMRGMTFQKLRDAVRAVIANAVLSVVFLLPAFLLIFLYDALLGWMTLAFGFLSLVTTVILGLRQMSLHGRVIRTVHHLTGQLFQFINGIAKLRIAAAESTAFAVLTRKYREKKRAELELGAREEHLQAFGAALPFLAGATLFLAATHPGRLEPVAVGDFLVVYLVFMVFQTAVARLGASFSAVAEVMPAFDQVRPFLAALPESTREGEPVEGLDGRLVFDHVTFRYAPDGPLILDDVSMHAEPGEFVAIAGESGSGKSTLFRLALGLGQPTSGAVYYDGRDLRRLNVKQLRRQIGAVPQEVRLHPDDIWDNIVGDREGTKVADAWEASRAAVVDRDIMSMPMGMMTYVGGSESLTSGGESQRIVIARALLGKPHVMLLDEATNWLDNDSQAKIMANLANLQSTRVVIAHRLSTLRLADRIYVMRGGRVVEEGSFVSLMAAKGVFWSLARRQMA